MGRFIKSQFRVISDEFRSKVACENDTINLVCFPSQRVAIFSASFGRTEYESMQCPQPRGVQEESKYYFKLYLIIILVNSFFIFYFHRPMFVTYHLFDMLDIFLVREILKNQGK